jgi:hypothetical protein
MPDMTSEDNANCLKRQVNTAGTRGGRNRFRPFLKPHPLLPSPLRREGESFGLKPLSPKGRGVGGEVNRCLLYLLLLLILLVPSCRRGAVEALPSQAPTPTTLSGGQNSGVTLAPIVTVTRAAPTPTAPSRCAPDPNTATAQYDIETAVDLDNRVATVKMRVSYRNDTGQPLQQIVFNIEPNRKPGLFTLNGLEAENPTVIDKYNLTGPRLEILLGAALQPSCRASLMLDFGVRPPTIAEGYISGKNGYFGYSERQLNLAEWLPEVAPFVNGGWLTPKAWPLGEYTIAPLADFTAQIKVLRNPDRQEPVEVIGPGEANRLSADTWQFKFAEARSFNISVSTGIAKVTASSDDGVIIDLYYFPKTQPVRAADGSPISGPQHALDTARAAVNRYARLYGPSPYSRIVVLATSRMASSSAAWSLSGTSGLPCTTESRTPG